MSITAETTIAAIANEHPLATRVFARHGIDFCCAGGEPLAKASAVKGLDVAALISELEEQISASGGDDVRWDEEPLPKLVDHIIATYHDPLREELPRLEAMMRKVHRVHGDKDPEGFSALLETVLAIKADIDQHLPKEEEILFPLIKAGKGGMALGPMLVMEREHKILGELLRRMRELTNDYVPREGACNTWRALWAGLEELERSLHEHIHLENNVLHPRARQQ